MKKRREIQNSYRYQCRKPRYKFLCKWYKTRTHASEKKLEYIFATLIYRTRLAILPMTPQTDIGVGVVRARLKTRATPTCRRNAPNEERSVKWFFFFFLPKSNERDLKTLLNCEALDARPHTASPAIFARG